MDVINLIRDSVITVVLALCAERVVNKIKNWWYKEEDIDINDVHINFIPQTTHDETIIVTRKGKNPEVFKYFSDVK